MTKNLILTTTVLIVAALVLALCAQNIAFHSEAYAHLPVPNVKSNASRIITSAAATSNNNAIITIHTTNSIQGNNLPT
jgi:hypothetical protein